MRLIAGLDSDNRCYIGKPLRDSEWLIGNVNRVLRPLQGKGFDVTPEDIVTQYLSLNPISLVFLYAESDVEKFFQAEVAHRGLLNVYMRADPPVRIQRKRTKGWRMPPNTISVCRPSMWGNPFRIDHEVAEAKAEFGKFSLTDSQLIYNTAKQIAVEKFESAYLDLSSVEMTDAQYLHMKKIRDRIRDLSGHNLACFCRDKPCHADILLKYANLKDESQSKNT